MNTQFIDNLLVIKKHYKLSYIHMEDIFGYGKFSTQENFVKGVSIPSYLYLIKVSDVVGIEMNRLCFEQITADELPARIGKYVPKESIVSEAKVEYQRGATQPNSGEERLLAIERRLDALEKK